jgi:hypothetical protein
MGLYDDVVVECPIAGVDDPTRMHWQTKDFEPSAMQTYKITAGGRLLEQLVHFEDRSDPTAPADSLRRLFGCMTPVEDGWRDMDYHGDLHCTSDAGGNDQHARVSFTARFTHGQLERIRVSHGAEDAGATDTHVTVDGSGVNMRCTVGRATDGVVERAPDASDDGQAGAPFACRDHGMTYAAGCGICGDAWAAGEIETLRTENTCLRQHVEHRTAQLERCTADARTYGERASCGVRTVEDAYALTASNATLSYDQAMGALLILLTKNGIAAWNGDGTSIVAQWLVRLSVGEPVDAASAPKTAAPQG